MSRSHAVSRSTEVDLTRTAERQLRALRGRRLKAAVRFLEELMAGGCAQAGYRLAGAGVLDHLCCRHLYGSDRGIVAWPSLDAAAVIAIGPHDQSVNDIYQLILAALKYGSLLLWRLRLDWVGQSAGSSWKELPIRQVRIVDLQRPR